MTRYSADAVRYWAASTSPGKDSVISEDKIQMGAKLVTKLWNVARFAEPFLSSPPPLPALQPLTPADRWVLSRTQKLLRRATSLLESYEYANAKSEIETFFWGDLTDNYLEMCKQRLYDPSHPSHHAARAALQHVLLGVLKLLAPFLPYVTEEIYQALFLPADQASIHRAPWPEPDPDLEDDQAELAGAALVEIATAVRRYKSERSLPLGSELARLQLVAPNQILEKALAGAETDLKSITRARLVQVSSALDPALLALPTESGLSLAIEA
jgi:valyl-tRNA synthetase